MTKTVLAPFIPSLYWSFDTPWDEGAYEVISNTRTPAVGNGYQDSDTGLVSSCVDFYNTQSPETLKLSFANSISFRNLTIEVIIQPSLGLVLSSSAAPEMWTINGCGFFYLYFENIGQTPNLIFYIEQPTKIVELDIPLDGTVNGLTPEMMNGQVSHIVATVSAEQVALYVNGSLAGTAEGIDTFAIGTDYTVTYLDNVFNAGQSGVTDAVQSIDVGFSKLVAFSAPDDFTLIFGAAPVAPYGLSARGQSVNTFCPSDYNIVSNISCIASHNYMFLAGVFISNEANFTTPPVLSYPTEADYDFPTLAPEIGQVFFIGDGYNTDGSQRIITIPANATKLCLGMRMIQNVPR